MAATFALILDADLDGGNNLIRIIDSDDDLARLLGVENWNPQGGYREIERDRFTFEFVEAHSLTNVETGYPDAASIQKVTFNG